MPTLSWLHFGDLHVTADDDWEGLRRFEALIAEANRHLTQGIDFAVLPGDNANNGTVEQYRLIRKAIDRLKLPLHIIPGDHDFEPGSLDHFHTVLGAERLPKTVEINGHRCLFLDLVSAGDGGPNFKLGPRQIEWLRQQLGAAGQARQRATIFMHAYPGDLKQDGERIGRLLSDHGVAVVDTGHTHYNELLNDGRVIYTATRSTGQIEEGGGEPGFSIGTLDGAAVSWRFKPLSAPWPLVLITSPVDRRLLTDSHSREQRPVGDFAVRAKVFGDDVAAVQLCIDDQSWVPMAPVSGGAALWSAAAAALGSGTHRVVVEAITSQGGRTHDEIMVSMDDAGDHSEDHASTRVDAIPGTDAHAVASWPEHGLLGTQLGPNKYGHGW
jgi:3',5'-cyclic AMP phosphodiesterase CpdA